MKKVPLTFNDGTTMDAYIVAQDETTGILYIPATEDNVSFIVNAHTIGRGLWMPDGPTSYINLGKRHRCNRELDDFLKREAQ